MVNQIIKLSGWRSRKLGGVTFYRCPGCGNCLDMPFWCADGLIQCFRCQSKFPHEEFKPVRRKRTIVECSDCGRGVPLVPSTFGMAGLGFICSDCSNYVAILYGNQFLQPGLVLDVAWNPAVCDRGECLSFDGPRFVPCRTTKDFAVLKVLQAVVKEEDSRFLFGDPKAYCAGLLVDSMKGRYLGFLVWTEDKYAVLRQIFIVKDERRKGHAEKLVKFWVGRYADRLHEKFGIESPNEQAISLHVKLGHLRIEGDRYVEIKCFRVQGV